MVRASKGNAKPIVAGHKPDGLRASRFFRTIIYMADWHEQLARDPEICGGELCARGTRIPVTVILDGLGEGSTAEEILASYPSLTEEHIRASLAYAAELAHEERLLPLRAS